jgi:hypothetical protein
MTSSGCNVSLMTYAFWRAYAMLAHRRQNHLVLMSQVKLNTVDWCCCFSD